jgi:hypothetical protein
MSYRGWGFLKGPPWNQGTNFGKYAQELAGVKDDFLSRARLGVLARFPKATTREVPALDPVGDPTPIAPTDALEEIGADRLRRRAPGQSDAAYATRVHQAWDDYAFLGSPFGLLTELAALGWGTANIVQDNGRYWFLTAGVLTAGTLMTMVTRGRPGWQFDTRDDLWSRFALLFTADAANLSGAENWAILNSTVHQWRPGMSTFMGTYVIVAGNAWGWPTAKVWGSHNWGSSTVRFIPPDGNPAVNV